MRTPNSRGFPLVSFKTFNIFQNIEGTQGHPNKNDIFEGKVGPNFNMCLTSEWLGVSDIII